MAVPKYHCVAVVGAGPLGRAAIHFLSQEKRFERIRVFDKRDRVGETWLYDPEPDIFPTQTSTTARMPSFALPTPEDETSRTGIYDDLDGNVGAAIIEFTHTAFPKLISARSIQRYGLDNPTTP